MSENNILRELQRKYDASNHDLGLFIRSLKAMTHLAKLQYGLDADWLCDAALHHLSAKTKTYIEDKRIGLLAALMVGHGSSFNQAMLAIGEWIGIGDTKIKKAYLAVCDEYKLPKDQRNLANVAFMARAKSIPYIRRSGKINPFRSVTKKHGPPSGRLIRSRRILMLSKFSRWPGKPETIKSLWRILRNGKILSGKSISRIYCDMSFSFRHGGIKMPDILRR